MNCHQVLSLYFRAVLALYTLAASVGLWTCPLPLLEHLPDAFLCIPLRSNSTFLPVYCRPCNFVYDVFVAGGFSPTLYSDSGSPSPFLFMVITREHFILALGECLLGFFVWACMLKLGSVFFEVRAFIKWSEKFVKPQLTIKKKDLQDNLSSVPSFFLPSFFPFKSFVINFVDKLSTFLPCWKDETCFSCVWGGQVSPRSAVLLGNVKGRKAAGR